MAPIRQASFAAGELYPGLWGRTELPSYAQGLRRMRNFYANRQGAAVSRPGTRRVCSAYGWTEIRLVPFVYSDTQSYVLEMGLGYCRFVSSGAQLAQVNPLTGLSEPYAVVTPITTVAQLAELKWCQSGDVMTFCAPGIAPFEVRRNSHTNWAVATINFDRPATDVFATLAGPLPSIGSGYPDTRQPREWQWMVSRLLKDEKGFEYETAPKLLTQVRTGSTFSSIPDKVLVSPTDPVTVEFLSGVPAGSRHRIYRGRGRMFGWVGDSDASTFTDTGAEPDYARQPPKGDNPFKVFSDATPPVLQRTEHPRVVSFFEERRVFANTAQRPGFLFFSATGDYANFDQQLLPVASDAAIYELAARRREEVRALVPMEKLLVFTNASVWSFAGSNGYISPVEANPPSAKMHLEVGTTWLEPLVVPGAVLMSRAKGTGVRDVVADFQQASYQGGDVSLQAQHLVDRYTLRDWCWAEDPHGLVWVVRSDGKLLSLTYDREKQVLAWGLHTLPDGATDARVWGICSVPEGTTDAVYLLVQRTLGGESVLYIERFEDRLLATVALDCAISLTGPAGVGGAGGFASSSPTPQYTFSGLDHLNGQSVWAVGDGVVYGPLSVADGSVTLPNAVRRVTVGLPFTCELELLDVALDVRTRQKNVSSVFFEVDSTGPLATGETAARLSTWTPPSLVPSALEGDPHVVRVNVQGGWNYRGRAVLRTTQPRPCTVYAVTREVEIGGP